MLAVIHGEAAKGLRIWFGAWRRAEKSQFRVKRQKKAFRAWLEILLMERHDRALELISGGCAGQADAEKT